MTTTAKQTETQRQLQNQVDSIAEDINELNFGINCDDEEACAFDYVCECIDLEFIVDRQKEYKSAKLLVAFGGPNIWINLEEHKVQGYWWGDYAEAHIKSDAHTDLDEAAKELFNC